MTWYMTEFELDSNGFSAGLRLQEQFWSYKLAAHAERGLALFALKYDENKLTRKVYFLPPNALEFCQQLLTIYSFNPCETPDLSTLVVRTGEFNDLSFWRDMDCL